MVTDNGDACVLFIAMLSTTLMLPSKKMLFVPLSLNLVVAEKSSMEMLLPFWLKFVDAFSTVTA